MHQSCLILISSAPFVRRFREDQDKASGVAVRAGVNLWGPEHIALSEVISGHEQDGGPKTESMLSAPGHLRSLPLA